MEDSSPRSWSEFTLDSDSSEDLWFQVHTQKLSISGAGAGGHEYQFVEEPPKDLKCSICLSVLRDPHLTSCCGNHFCETCIDLIKGGSKPCPLCQQPDFNSMLDKSLCRKVNELCIHCPNSQEGCKWTGDLKDVQKHLDSQCKFVQVRCSLCRTFVPKIHFSEHMKVVCPKRKFSCEDCGYYSTWEFVTGEHRSVCVNRTLPCPNKCNMGNVKRRDMEEHLRTHCPLQTVPCDFQFAGCEQGKLKKDVGRHNDENIAYHLSLLAKKFHSELAKKDEEIERLQATIKDQSEQIHALKTPKLLPPVDFYMPDFDCYEPANRWFSDPFYSHPSGYKMCLSVYPNGTGKGAGSHLSVFVNLMRGEYDDNLSWPFRGNITVTVVTEGEDFEEILNFTNKAPAAAARRVTDRDMNRLGQGRSRFVDLDEVCGCDFLHFHVQKVECTCIC